MGLVDKNYFEENMTPLKRIAHYFFDLIKVVCVSLAIIIPVRYFLIQPFYVRGASMEPSFFDHEYLIIDEISYRFREPARGDIVVFKYPKDPSQYFIKRIVGLPGEKVEIKDSQVYIYPSQNNDSEEESGAKFILDENFYLDGNVQTIGNKAWALGPDEYYVLGDNRESSLDSRNFGPVYGELIVGRVWLRGWPFWRAAIFQEINYSM